MKKKKEREQEKEEKEKRSIHYTLGRRDPNSPQYQI